MRHFAAKVKARAAQAVHALSTFTHGVWLRFRRK